MSNSEVFIRCLSRVLLRVRSVNFFCHWIIINFWIQWMLFLGYRTHPGSWMDPVGAFFGVTERTPDPGSKQNPLDLIFSFLQKSSLDSPG